MNLELCLVLVLFEYLYSHCFGFMHGGGARCLCVGYNRAVQHDNMVLGDGREVVGGRYLEEVAFVMLYCYIRQ